MFDLNLFSEKRIIFYPKIDNFSIAVLAQENRITFSEMEFKDLSGGLNPPKPGLK